MAASGQSLRFCGPGSAGPSGGSFDALNRILADLCTRGSPKVSTLCSLSLSVSYFLFGSRDVPTFHVLVNRLSG